MSAVAATTDSNLSGKPSDDIDNQTGPAIGGTNVESPGSSLNAGKKPVTTENNQGGSTGNNANKNAGDGSK